MSDRSKTPIEPYLADQWFVKMDELAQSAMDAVTDGRVKIQPERYAKSYLDWLSEKRDWPVSRQLWWGHRIPVWTKAFKNQQEKDSVWNEVKRIHYTNDVVNEDCYPYHEWDPQTFEGYAWVCVRDENSPSIAQLEAAGFVQEPDVLDTWFSSALWPHSTLGWPEQTPELEYFYPTSVLVTSRDIITLWVARMVLTGLYNVGKIPFSQVFIHPKILDGFGETMSKSKGNGVDPLDVISMYGADSLRFGLAYMATETQDVRMPVEFVCPHCGKTMEQTLKNRVLPKIACSACGKEFSTQWAKEADAELPRGPVTSERFAVARNFCNKLWNASRFAMLNLEGFTAGPINEAELLLEDRWLLSRLNTVTQQVTTHLDHFRFAEAARTLYDFAWDDFCSFYVEMIKTRLTDEGKRTNVQRLLAYALDVLLRLLHPITPFVTEEVWALLNQLAPRTRFEQGDRAESTYHCRPVAGC